MICSASFRKQSRTTSTRWPCSQQYGQTIARTRLPNALRAGRQEGDHRALDDQALRECHCGVLKRACCTTCDESVCLAASPESRQRFAVVSSVGISAACPGAICSLPFSKRKAQHPNLPKTPAKAVSASVLTRPRSWPVVGANTMPSESTERYADPCVAGVCSDA